MRVTELVSNGDCFLDIIYNFGSLRWKAMIKPCLFKDADYAPEYYQVGVGMTPDEALNSLIHHISNKIMLIEGTNREIRLPDDLTI